jgi:hypothetical protein
VKLPKGRVSLATAAKHIDVTPRAFTDLLNAETVIRHAADEGYVLAEVRLQYIRHIRSIASGHGSAMAGLSAERALLAAEQREGIKLKNAQTRGDLISVQSVIAIVSRDYAILRERILSASGKIADSLAMRPRDEVELALRDELCEALRELSEPEAVAENAGAK